MFFYINFFTIVPLTDDDSLLKVLVHVKDVDDNPPGEIEEQFSLEVLLIFKFYPTEFDRKVFTGGIATDGADFGSLVLTLSAKDPDENSVLTYKIQVCTIVFNFRNQNIKTSQVN